MTQPHLCALLLLASALGGQDVQQPTDQEEQKESREDVLERLRSRRGAGPEIPEFRRADGSVVLPGEVPAAASVEAKAMWRGLLKTLDQAKPMQAFQLAFFLRQQAPDPQVNKTNDLDLNFSYLAPRFVRAELESGRTHLRGPSGDFLLDKQEVFRLVGRDFKQDIEQLDQMGAIASNFVALTQPVATLRLAQLELAKEPPRELHPKLRKEADALVWLSVTSPDLFLRMNSARPTGDGLPLYRAQLGIDPESATVHLAVIHEQRGDSHAPGTAMCVRMADHRRRAKLQIPHHIQVFSIDPSTRPERFYETPGTTLWLNGERGRLRAALSPEDFLPPE